MASRAGLQSPREVTRLPGSSQALSAGVQADEGKCNEHVKLPPIQPRAKTVDNYEMVGREFD